MLAAGTQCWSGSVGKRQVAAGSTVGSCWSAGRKRVVGWGFWQIVGPGCVAGLVGTVAWPFEAAGTAEGDFWAHPHPNYQAHP